MRVKEQSPVQRVQKDPESGRCFVDDIAYSGKDFVSLSMCSSFLK